MLGPFHFFAAGVLCVINSAVIMRSFDQYIINTPALKVAAAAKRGSLSINSNRSTVYDDALTDAKAVDEDEDEDKGQSDKRVRSTDPLPVPAFFFLPTSFRLLWCRACDCSRHVALSLCAPVGSSIRHADSICIAIACLSCPPR